MRGIGQNEHNITIEATYTAPMEARGLKEAEHCRL
jgi:hypothetical protein